MWPWVRFKKEEEISLSQKGDTVVEEEKPQPREENFGSCSVDTSNNLIRKEVVRVRKGITFLKGRVGIGGAKNC